jgi:predicted O-methyltransferase YrrM
LLEADLIEALEGVPGWLPADEAWALHRAVFELGDGDATVVEIGSWQGRSAVAIGSALRERGGGVLHAVDPHRDTPLHEATGEADTYAAFAANVEAAGLSGCVRPLRASSIEARASFADGSVDLLFVDGSHRYEDVMADIDTWMPALAEGATVAFHDVRSEPGVRRALAERVEPESSPFHDLRTTGELLLAEAGST